MKFWTDIKIKQQLRRRYSSYLPSLMQIAKEHGYALAVHGSMTRDLDLIAVPWSETVVAPETLVMALEYAVVGAKHSREYWKQQAARERKPYGRKAYVILWAHLNDHFETPMHRHAYIDLSVMPRRRK